MGKGRFTFLRFPGRRHSPAQGVAGRDLGLFLHGRGEYAFDLISVAPFQDVLREIARTGITTAHRQECGAALVCRDGTPLDRNTVAAEIGGQMVGYCPSYLATQYREWLDKWRFSAARVHCNAVIVGRWSQADGRIASYGVKLDIELPFKATTIYQARHPAP